MRNFFVCISSWLWGFFFRVGVFVLAMCVPFYVLSFAHMAILVEYLSVAAQGSKCVDYHLYFCIYYFNDLSTLLIKW